MASIIGSFFSLVVAVALIVVGFVMVKKIHSGSGLMIGIAGVITLLMNCCCRVLDAAVFQIAMEEGIEELQTAWAVISVITYRVPMILTIVGVAMLAKHISSNQGEPPETRSVAQV